MDLSCEFSCAVAGAAKKVPRTAMKATMVLRSESKSAPRLALTGVALRVAVLWLGGERIAVTRAMALSGYFKIDAKCPLSGRLCCKTIFVPKTRNIDSRSNTNAHH